MKQMSLATTGFELVTKRKREREFLDEMNLVIPWSELLVLIAPHAPAGKTGRPPFDTNAARPFSAAVCGHSDPAIRRLPGRARSCDFATCSKSAPRLADSGRRERQTH